MEREELEQKWEAVEVLELKVNKFIYEIKEKLDIYNLDIQISNVQMETLLHDVLEVEMEETEAPEVTKGYVHIKKDGKGKYYALKNLYFFLVDFLEGVFNLTQTDKKYWIVVGAIFLYRIMQQFGVDMSEEQTAICVALYQAAKRYVVTDENVMKYIVEGLRESDYCELGEKKIGRELSELIEMGLVSIEDGRYEITEILLF